MGVSKMRRNSNTSKIEWFRAVVDFTLQHEGFTSCDPLDPGRETIFGVSSRWYPEVVEKLKDPWRTYEEKKALATAFYYEKFWREKGIEKLSYPICCFVFDFAVNTGAKRAVTTLQRIINKYCPFEYGGISFHKIKVDGVIGRKETIPTTEALLDVSYCNFCRDYLEERIRFYTKLRLFNKYGRGWIARVLELRRKFY